MGKDKEEAGPGLLEIGLSVDDLVRRGARQVIGQVIELELAALLEQYANVRTLSGRRLCSAGCDCVCCGRNYVVLKQLA